MTLFFQVDQGVIGSPDDSKGPLADPHGRLEYGTRLHRLDGPGIAYLFFGLGYGI